MPAKPQILTVWPFLESLLLLLEALLCNMVHYFNYRGVVRQLFKDRINVFEKQ